MLSILIIEDLSEDVGLIQRELEKAGYILTVKVVDDEPGFVETLEDFSPDIILSDYKLPTFSGFEALVIARNIIPSVPFIFVTGAIGEEIAAETIINGASGFVLKSKLSHLPPLLKKILQEQQVGRGSQLARTNKRIRARIEANIEALDKIHSFLANQKNTKSEWKEAMEEVERLKENLS